MRNKKIFAIITVVLLLCVTVCGCSQDNSPSGILKDYEKLSKKIGNVEYGSKAYLSTMRSIGDLYGRIAEGDKNQAAEYASLIQAMTKNKYNVDADDVFEFADNSRDVHYHLADGKEFGLTGIGIDTNTENGSVLYIKGYFADYVKYSISVLDASAPEVNGNGEIPYDGNLGEYRLLVEFADIKIAEGIDITDVIDIKLPNGESSGYKCRAYYATMETIYIYIGSDTPWDESLNYNSELGMTEDRVEIPIG